MSQLQSDSSPSFVGQDRVDHWLGQACEARALGMTMHTAEARHYLFQIAAAYDRLAVRAQAQVKTGAIYPNGRRASPKQN